MAAFTLSQKLIRRRRKVTPISGSLGPTAHAATLPTRFDVHCLESFKRWIAKQSPMRTHDVTIDAGLVRFIDSAAVEAVLDARQSLIDRGIDLHIVNPSTALRATLELTSVASLLISNPTTTPGKALS